MDLSAWLALAWQSAGVLVLLHVLLGVLFGAAVARWSAYPLWLGISLGVLFPVIGPTTAGIVWVARRRSSDTNETTVAPRRLTVIWLGVPLAGAIAALTLPWWTVRVGAAPGFAVYPTGHFLDVLLIVTIVVIAISAAIVGAFGRVHPAAILVLVPIGVWSFALWMLGSTTVAVQGVIASVAAVDLTFGDVLRWVGVDPAYIAFAGSAGLDPDGLDVTDSAGAVSIQLGFGWFAMLAVPISLAAWAAWACFVRWRVTVVDQVAWDVRS
jgi:hypothetical protein